MNLQIANNASLQDIVHGYSGRHLQYAIKLGIMPTPETFSLLLNGIINTENALTLPIDARLIETRLN